MNKTVTRQRSSKSYPNAASRQYYIDKAIDTVLTVVFASAIWLAANRRHTRS